MANPIDHARKVFRRIRRVYPVRFRVRVVAGPNSFTRLRKDGPEIVLGCGSIWRAYQKGFSEYPGLAVLLDYRQPRGLVGVHCLCLHEFAHALCWIKHKRSTLRHSPGCAQHQATYARFYRQLLKQFTP